MQLRASAWVAILCAGAIISGCGGSGGGSNGGGGTGTLSLSMTDASTDQYDAVYLTIDDVQVHLGGNEGNPNSWQSVNMPRSPITVNLLELVNGVREDLGLASLRSGSYTQMRLIIGRNPEPGAINILSQAHPYANYVIDSGTFAVHELKVPSGYQTGFKIVGGFVINTNGTTELVLDFDASRSVIQAGNSGQWLLKPTVKITELKDASIVRGYVTIDGTTATGIPGAIVSAQQYVPGAPDDKDKVVVEGSTITYSDGSYSLFLEPDDYNIVAVTQGRVVPPVAQVTTEAAEVVENVNFRRSDQEVGNVAGTVTITGAGSEIWATLSFRQTLSSPSTVIEIKSINVRNGGGYSISLPPGSYTVVVSSFGHTTTSESITVSNGGITKGGISLP